jgi:phage shock protein C
MLGGVAAGIAAYANVDPTLVRIGFVVTAIVTGGTAALIYPLLWIIMPEEPADNPGWPTGPAPTA